MEASNASSRLLYSTVVADPPWPYAASGPWGNGGTVRPGHMRARHPSPSADAHYAPMSLDELAVLEPPAAADAHLYLWTTNAFVDRAYELARRWGFKPKTLCTWVKTYQDDPVRISMKTGYYFRGATEHWVFAVRGSLRLATTEALPTAYLWPRLPHSVKPDAFYDLVEKASPGPYLEMFSRRSRFGWDYWGNESLETVEMVG